MEIIYVWIDEYKNIKKQGFNFSSKFECEYDEEKNEFIVNKNKDSINIFPDNINLTAIIGKNGSGKSSLIENILLLMFKENEENENFLVFLKDERFYATKKLENCNCFKRDDMFNLYFNYSIDTMSPSFFEQLKNFNIRMNEVFFENKNSNAILIPDKNYKRIYIDRIFKDIAVDYFEIKRHYKFSDNDIKNFILETFKEENFVFYPNQFKLAIDKSKYLYDIENYGKQINPKFNLKNIYNLLKERVNFDLFSFDESNFRDKFLLLGIIYLCSVTKFDSRSGCRICELLYFIGKYNTNIDRYNEAQLHREIEDALNELLDLISRFDLCKLDNFKDGGYNFYDREVIIDIIEYLKFVLNSKRRIDYFKDYNSYKEDLSKEFFEKLPPFILIELIDSNNRKFLDLSFGEKLLNVLFFKILSVVLKRKENVINLIYDEFDIGMHPEMQRSFIKFIVKISGFMKQKYFNIILATHSPFILSDIPKESIIFLENGKLKNKFKKEENTFGANIYDIFEKGFFLDNSIGKYSEEWIKALDLLLSFFNAYKLANEKESNVFPLRNLLNRWYVAKNENGELSKEEMDKQDKKLLSENKEDLFKDLFEKKEKEIEYEKFKFLIDEEFNLKPEIEDYINIIGDKIVRNHLLDLYKRVKNESK